MQFSARAVLGLVVISALGCHSFSHQGPGYTGNYPVQRGQSPYPYQQSQRGTTMPPQMAMNNVPPQAWQQPQLGSPGTAPMSIPSPQLSLAPPPAAGTGGPKLVPDYPDAPAGQAALTAPSGDDDFQRPVSSLGAKLGSGIDDADETAANDEFAPPIPLKNVSSSREIPEQAAPVTRSTENPYKFDSKGYTWLRGVVDFDEEAKVWRITYNPDPLGSDPYGGSLTLIDDDQLSSLLPNDVVLVEGRINMDRRDQFKKPMYQVDRAMRLVPKNAAGQ